MSASARCECEVTEGAEETTEEKEEEGVGMQSQKQETWGKIIEGKLWLEQRASV